MTATVPLKHGLCARYITRAEITAKKRAEARKDRQRNDAQPEPDEEP